MIGGRDRRSHAPGAVVYALHVTGGSGTCPSCGNALAAASPFCPRCGGPSVLAAGGSTTFAETDTQPQKITVVLDDLDSSPPRSDHVSRIVVPPSPPVPPSQVPPPSAGHPHEPRPSHGSRSTITIVAIALVVLLIGGVAGAAVLTTRSDDDARGAPSPGASSAADEDGDPSSGAGGEEAPGSTPDATAPGTDEGGDESADGGDGGSADEYCAVVDEIVAASRDSQAQYAEIPEDDPLRGLAFLLGAIGDIQIYIQRLGDAAPPELQPDFEAISGDMDAELPDPTDPMSMIGALAAALVQGMMHQNSYTRIDQYTEENCGVTLFGPSSAAAPPAA